MQSYLPALCGGILIGLASWLLMASLGRIAGISGIVVHALVDARASAWRWAFMAGLVGGGAVFSWWLATPIQAPRPIGLLVAGGLLVGFGTVLGSGCTSGHGVCGLGRRSQRSLVAVLCFMGSAIATVWVVTSIAN